MNFINLDKSALMTREEKDKVFETLVISATIPVKKGQHPKLSHEEKVRLDKANRDCHSPRKWENGKAYNYESRQRAEKRSARSINSLAEEAMNEIRYHKAHEEAIELLSNIEEQIDALGATLHKKTEIKNEIVSAINMAKENEMDIRFLTPLLEKVDNDISNIIDNIYRLTSLHDAIKERL